MKDHYKTLMVDREATAEVIKKAYRALAQCYHPDRNPQVSETYADRKMKQINEAYDILSDTRKRAGYDRELQKQESFYHNRYTDTVLNQSVVAEEPVFIVSGNAERDWKGWGVELFDTKSEFMDTVYYEQKGERMTVSIHRSRRQRRSKRPRSRTW